MNTCLDCAWFELCEPEDLLCACPHFVRPEELKQEIAQELFEEWCHHQDKADTDAKPRDKC